MFYLAERFGKFVHEVEGLRSEHLAEYLAYFKIKREEEEKALKKAKQKQPPPRTQGRRRK